MIVFAADLVQNWRKIQEICRNIRAGKNKCVKREIKLFVQKLFFTLSDDTRPKKSLNKSLKICEIVLT